MSVPNFSEIVGNEPVKKQLSQMLAKKAIGHALLFVGPQGVGKSLFAEALAASLIADEKKRAGPHPDIHHYYPEGKLGLHSIQAFRHLCGEVHLPPYEASWKVFIIHEAERMLKESAHALLKTFEEPPSRTLMILLSRSQAALVPTLVSRCRVIHFRPIPTPLLTAYLQQHYPQLDASTCARVAGRAQGSIGSARQLIQQEDHRSHRYLLALLAQGPLGNYRLLQEATQCLAEQVEAVKKQKEEEAQADLFKIPREQLSAQHCALFEKEIEGLSALASLQEAQMLFEVILSWQRDLNFLLMGGSPDQLMNRESHHVLEQAVQRGECKPLDQVYHAVDQAYVALQRSVPLALCLENLLLKLESL